MSLVDYQINDLIDNGKLLLERHDTLSTEIDEVMVIMMAERIIQAPGLTEVERQSISFIYLLSSVVVALVLSGLATDSAIEVVLLNKDLLLPILEHNSIESTDTLISNIICNLPSVDGTIELDNCATRIKNQVYVFFSMQTRRSLHQYEKATIALLSLESPEDYLTGLLQAERGLRMPSIAQKPNPILAVDRNGYRIRVYSGNQLNHDEKRITGAYRLGQ